MIATKRRAAPPSLFGEAWRYAALQSADRILAAPPASPYTERHPPRGQLVLRFVLPLELAKPANSTRHAAGWQMAKHREDVLAMVKTQWLQRSPRLLDHMPLPGRPLARCIRFSSVEPDATAAWWKTCIDVLLCPRMRGGRRIAGIGLLADDRPSMLETRAWHEKVPRGQGFALVEVYN